MAQELKHLQIRKIENAYGIKILSHEFTPEVEDEVYSYIGMLFFQTRSHIQLDVTNLNYLPLNFISHLLGWAKDLMAKKRVLVLIGVPYSSYHFFQRFKLTGLFYQLKGGMVRTKA